VPGVPCRENLQKIFGRTQLAETNILEDFDQGGLKRKHHFKVLKFIRKAVLE
jgi:hypothetical protein